MSQKAVSKPLETIIDELYGYHDYPECRGVVSLEIDGRTWVLSCADGIDSYWDDAPTIREIIESGYGDMLDLDTYDDGDLDEEVEEFQIVDAVMDRANQICNDCEASYDAIELDRRIDHIMEQPHDRIVIHYPRDFANEFNIVFITDESGDYCDCDRMTDKQAVKKLESWLTDKAWAGDVIDQDGRSLDTFNH